MFKWIAIGAAALVVIVGIGFVAGVGPFGQSPEEQIEESIGEGANCTQAGLTELAGERETYYRCSWKREAIGTRPGGFDQSCAAIVDGRVYPVSNC